MIALRDIQLGDEEMVRVWRNSPEVNEYLFADQHITAEAHREWFQKILNDQTFKYWIVTYDGQDVGVVNLFNIDRDNQRCYWGFYIAYPEMRGRGIGTFVEYEILRIVFDELGFNKLCGETLSWNKILQIHYSFGYQQEGCLRQHVIKDGRPVDVVVIGILRDEWELKKPELQERLRRQGLL